MLRLLGLRGHDAIVGSQITGQPGDNCEQQTLLMLLQVGAGALEGLAGRAVGLLAVDAAVVIAVIAGYLALPSNSQSLELFLTLLPLLAAAVVSSIDALAINGLIEGLGATRHSFDDLRKSAARTDVLRTTVDGLYEDISYCRAVLQMALQVFSGGAAVTSLLFLGTRWLPSIVSEVVGRPEAVGAVLIAAWAIFGTLVVIARAVRKDGEKWGVVTLQGGLNARLGAVVDGLWGPGWLGLLLEVLTLVLYMEVAVLSMIVMAIVARVRIETVVGWSMILAIPLAVSYGLLARRGGRLRWRWAVLPGVFLVCFPLLWLAVRVAEWMSWH